MATLTTKWKTIGAEIIGSLNGDMNIYLQAKYSYQDASNLRTYGVQYRAVAVYDSNTSIIDAQSNAICGGDGVNNVTGHKSDAYQGGVQYVLCKTSTTIIAGAQASVQCQATLNFPSYGWSGTVTAIADLPRINTTTHAVAVQIQDLTSSSIRIRATSDVYCNRWEYSLNNSAWTVFSQSVNQSATTEINIPSTDTYTLKVRARTEDGGEYIISSIYTFNNITPTVTIELVEKKRDSLTIRLRANTICSEWKVIFGNRAQTITGNGLSKVFVLDGLNTYTTYSIYGTAQNANSDLTGQSVTISIRTKGGGGRLKVNGTWKEVVPHVKVNGVWKESVAYTKVGNTWKENA